MLTIESDLKDRIIELVDDVPVDGVSENMLYHSLKHEDWEVSREDIERTASELVDDGPFEVTGEIHEHRRFSLDEE